MYVYFAQIPRDINEYMTSSQYNTIKYRVSWSTVCRAALDGHNAVVVAELDDLVHVVEHVALQPREAGHVLEEAGLVARPRQELEPGRRQPAQDLGGN